KRAYSAFLQESGGFEQGQSHHSCITSTDAGHKGGGTTLNAICAGLAHRLPARAIRVYLLLSERLEDDFSVRYVFMEPERRIFYRYGKDDGCLHMMHAARKLPKHVRGIDSILRFAQNVVPQDDGCVSGQYWTQRGRIIRPGPNCVGRFYALPEPMQRSQRLFACCPQYIRLRSFTGKSRFVFSWWRWHLKNLVRDAGLT